MSGDLPTDIHAVRKFTDKEMLNSAKKHIDFLEEEFDKKDARIKELEAESKRQSAIINHIKESGTMGDIYCGDKSPFANGWYSVIEFIELATRGEI